MPAGRRSLHGDGAGRDAGDDDGAHQRQRKMSATVTVARARIVSDGSKIPRIDPKNAGSGYVVDVQRTGPPPSPSLQQRKVGGRRRWSGPSCANHAPATGVLGLDPGYFEPCRVVARTRDGPSCPRSALPLMESIVVPTIPSSARWGARRSSRRWSCRTQFSDLSRPGLIQA